MTHSLDPGGAGRIWPSAVSQGFDHEAAKDSGPEGRDALSCTEKDKFTTFGQADRGGIGFPGDVPDSSKRLAGTFYCLPQSAGRQASAPIIWMGPGAYIQVSAAHERVAEKSWKNTTTLNHAVVLLDKEHAVIPVLKNTQLMKHPECKKWIPRRTRRQKFSPGRFPHLDTVRFAQATVRTGPLHTVS